MTKPIPEGVRRNAERRERSHQRTCARAGVRVGLEAVLMERSEHANVGIAQRCAASEGQTETGHWGVERNVDGRTYLWTADPDDRP